MVPYEIGKFVWPSIWVVVFAGLSLRVAVLAGGGCPYGGGSSSGRRARGSVVLLVEWGLFVGSSRLSSDSPISSLLAMILESVPCCATGAWVAVDHRVVG